MLWSGVMAQSLSPGNEQREFWGSEAAERPGSRNLAGIKNPAIDGLIEKLIYAPDRAGLVTATRALDRALLWNHYVVPQWHLAGIRYAYWDRFGFPENLPPYNPTDITIWWSKDGVVEERPEPSQVEAPLRGGQDLTGEGDGADATEDEQG